jgi:hypothetical protein
MSVATVRRYLAAKVGARNSPHLLAHQGVAPRTVTTTSGLNGVSQRRAQPNVARPGG